MKIYALGERKPEEFQDFAALQGLPEGQLTVSASRHAYHVEALALYSQWDETVQVTARSLHGEGKKLDGIVTCLNTEGVDAQGKPYIRPMKVKAGRIAILYLAFRPKGAPMGTYEGSVQIGDRTLPIKLILNDELVFDEGCDDPNGLARLKWLDSTRLTFDQELAAGYEPLAVQGNLIGMTGKVVQISHEGWIEDVTSFIDASLTLANEAQAQLFSRPMQLTVEGQKFKYFKLKISGEGRSGEIVAEGKSEAMRIETHAVIGYEGRFDYVTTLTAEQDICIPGITLSLSFAHAPYAAGLGLEGGKLRDVRYRWDDIVCQNSVWVGDLNCGLRVRFLGAEEKAPVGYGNYAVDPVPLPRAGWENHGSGGISLKREGEDGALLQAYTGGMVFPKGKSVTFVCRLSLTPFHPVDWKKHFSRQFACPPDFNGGKKAFAALQEDWMDGVNLEYGSPLNPHRNAPLSKLQELKTLIMEAHKRDFGITMSYSTGALSKHAPEWQALCCLEDGVPVLSKDGKEVALPPVRIVGAKGKQTDESVLTRSAREENYYVECIHYLIDSVGLDGVVAEDPTFGTATAERVKKLFDRKMGGRSAGVTMRVNNPFNHENGWRDAMDMGTEQMPFVDRLQMGAGYASSPDADHALVSLSGFPYGLTADFAENCDPWLPLLFGARPVSGKGKSRARAAEAVRLFNRFEVWNAKIRGFWDPLNPVGTDHPEVLVTSFIKGESLLAVFYNTSDKKVSFEVGVENRLGYTSQNKKMTLPRMEDMQKRKRFTYRNPVKLGAKKGMVLEIDPTVLTPRKK